MIPVVGIPVLNRADLLLRCVRSIRYPVGKLVIVNNGHDAGVAAVCEQINGERDFDLRIHKPGSNLGVAASWNWIMQSEPGAEYWLLVGNDIMFTDGDAEKIDRFVRAHPHFVVMPANQGHSLMAITTEGVRRIGYFDENHWPAYVEDGDHMYRVKLAEAPWQDVPDVHAVHGEAPSWGSHTIFADPKLRERNRITHGRNWAYHARKWGGPPGEEVYLHPYNDASLTLRDWRIDEDHLRANRNGNST